MYTVASPDPDPNPRGGGQLPDPDPNPRGGGQLPNPNECNSTLMSGSSGGCTQTSGTSGAQPPHLVPHLSFWF